MSERTFQHPKGSKLVGKVVTRFGIEQLDVSGLGSKNITKLKAEGWVEEEASRAYRDDAYERNDPKAFHVDDYDV